MKIVEKICPKKSKRKRYVIAIKMLLVVNLYSVLLQWFKEFQADWLALTHFYFTKSGSACKSWETLGFIP